MAKNHTQTIKSANMQKHAHWWQKIYHFLFQEESILSWIANIILAFVLIKFVFYPVLTLLTGSALPVVAVVSGSMEHKAVGVCSQYNIEGLCMKRTDETFVICGKTQSRAQVLTIAEYWRMCGDWYEQRNISLDVFKSFSFVNGFNTGDVMLIVREKPQDIKIGDTIVFMSHDNIPIIHRVVMRNETHFHTKGDHNQDSNSVWPRDETAITLEQYQGTAVLRIPFIGYVKIAFVNLILFARSTYG